MKSMKRAFWITGTSLKFWKERPAPSFKNFGRSFCNVNSPTGNVTSPSLNPLNYINRKLRKIIEFYEEFSGLKEIKLAQKRVEDAGEALVVLQEERRRTFSILTEIQNNLKGVYAQLEHTKRGDNNYIRLITEEYNLIKKEEEQQGKFKVVEKAERDQFTLFSHLVKSAHEKERAQSQRTKYWSIIGSVVGAMIGIIGSAINSHLKESELRKLILESSNSNLELGLNKFFENYAKLETNKPLQESINMRNMLVEDGMSKANVNNSKVHKYLDEILIKTNCILNNMEETLKLMENMNQFELYKLESEKGSQVLFMNLQSLRDSLRHDNYEMRKIIWRSSLIIGGAIFTRILF